MSPAISMVCTRLGQVQQAQQVAGGAARAAHGLRGLLVREAELADQALQALGLFQRVQVFALDVLDQRHGGGGLVGHVAHQHRHLCPGPASLAARKRRSPAMISYLPACSPSASGRTRIGCMMPWALMLSASSYSAPSSMRVRGWY